MKNNKGKKKSNNIFRLLRIVKDWSVKDLASELRVTPAYVNMIENGERKPSSRLIKDYAEILDIDEGIILNFCNESGKDSKFEEILLSLLNKI